jgi:hypothetical protein
MQTPNKSNKEEWLKMAILSVEYTSIWKQCIAITEIFNIHITLQIFCNRIIIKIF